MNDEALTQAPDTFDTTAPPTSATVVPDTASPVVGLALGEEDELIGQMFTVLLASGMIMSVRFFSGPEEFASHLANGDVVKVMTLGSIVKDDPNKPERAWIPLYLNAINVIGYSPVVHVPSQPAAPPPAPTPPPEADPAAAPGDPTQGQAVNIDVV